MRNGCAYACIRHAHAGGKRGGEKGKKGAGKLPNPAPLEVEIKKEGGENERSNISNNGHLLNRAVKWLPLQRAS